MSESTPEVVEPVVEPEIGEDGRPLNEVGESLNKDGSVSKNQPEEVVEAPVGEHDDTVAADGRLFCATCGLAVPCPSWNAE